MKNIYILITLLAACQLAFSQGADKPRYRIETHRAGVFLGNIDIELFPSIAPQHVNNFDSLVAMQFYDSTAFHRVVPNFVIQGGDPNSINGPVSTWGMGQPWQVNVPAEFSVARHYRGRIGAARDLDTNSANSQFYISVVNTFSLDGQYTVFGQVTAGLDVVDTIVNSPRDVNDVPLQKIEMFITYTGVNDTIPAAPQLVSPADQSVNVPGGSSFQWNNVSDGVIYTLQISDDSTFNSVLINKWTGGITTSVAGLQPATNYFWRVKTDNGGHESTWSSIYKFTTGVAAQLLYPPDNSVNIPMNPYLQWSSVPNVAAYNLQIDSDSLFTLPFTANYLGITGNSKQVNLSANTLYYWRVRYFIGSTPGFNSEVFSFTTGSTTSSIAETELQGSFIKNIYPVPAHDRLTIDLHLKGSSLVDISLIDMSGKRLSGKNDVVKITEEKLELLLKGIASGNYILEVTTTDMKESRRIEVK